MVAPKHDPEKAERDAEISKANAEDYNAKAMTHVMASKIAFQCTCKSCQIAAYVHALVGMVYVAGRLAEGGKPKVLDEMFEAMDNIQKKHPNPEDEK